MIIIFGKNLRADGYRATRGALVTDGLREIAPGPWRSSLWFLRGVRISDWTTRLGLTGSWTKRADEEASTWTRRT